MVDPKLNTFLTLVEEKTTVRCAEALHLSQPAVTQHIRALEAEYGVKLFAKEGRRLTLTEAGARLIRGHSQIQQNAVHLFNPHLPQFFHRVTIIAANDGYFLPKLAEAFTRSNYCILVLIYAYKSPLGSKFFTYLYGMSCTS